MIYKFILKVKQFVYIFRTLANYLVWRVVYKFMTGYIIELKETKYALSIKGSPFEHETVLNMIGTYDSTMNMKVRSKVSSCVLITRKNECSICLWGTHMLFFHMGYPY